MSADLAILVPVLRRPHRVAPTLRGFYRTAPGCRVLFIADPDDHEELAAIRDEGAEYIAPGGNYARKIHAGVAVTDEKMLFLGADDLEPQSCWLEAAAAVMVDGIEVVGVNDLIRRRGRRQQFATHFVVTRKYTERGSVDGPGLLHEGYDHSWVDNEFVGTAKSRQAYAYCETACVRHLHPMNDSAPDDEVYRKGRAQFHSDRRLFESRKHLWTV